MFFPLNTRYLFLFNEKEIQNLRNSEFYEIQKDATLSMYFSRRHRGDVSTGSQLSAISKNSTWRKKKESRKLSISDFQFSIFNFQFILRIL
jgi:hypothetical protein